MDLQNLTDAEAVTVPEAVARREELIGERLRVLGFLLERRGDRANVDPRAYWDSGDPATAARTVYLVASPDDACEPEAAILLSQPGFSTALDQANIPVSQGSGPFLRAGFVLIEGTLLPSEFPQFTLTLGHLTVAVLLSPGTEPEEGEGEQKPVAHALLFGPAALAPEGVAEAEQEAPTADAALQAAVDHVRRCREERTPVNLVRIAADFGVDFSALIAAVKNLPPMRPTPPE